MSTKWWIALAVTMGVSCVILLTTGDSLALAATVMCVISVLKAAESVKEP